MFSCKFSSNIRFLCKNNEAQIYPKIKNKLRTIEARVQMQMYLKTARFFIEKHNTHVITCGVGFIAGLSAVRNSGCFYTGA